MSSITAQQAKLDLELVLKEKRLEIGKCNERLNPGKTQREPTVQVVLDALALTPCYSTFLITKDVPEVTPSYYLTTNEEDKTNVDDNAEGDKDEEMDYTTDIPTTEAEIVSPMDVPIHHEVQSDEHLDARLRATRDEFMSYLLASITARIIEMVTESLKHAILAEEYSQPQSLYEAVALRTKFELKKILIDKMDKSDSYLSTLEHRECYDGLIKSYKLDKTLFSTYDKVYSLKKIRKEKDKDDDPFAGLDRGLKKRKITKDAEPTKGLKSKESKFGSSKGAQSQSKSSGNWLTTLVANADKPSKTFDDLMSTPVDFFAFIMNGLKINNPTLEPLLGPAFKLLKVTRTNYAELEYDCEECYKALLEKLDWENPEGIEDMAQNIWSLVKVAYDKRKLWVISHWYSYLREIEVQRADNDLYTFKEGNFLRVYINDIEDMLILIVQNRLINLSGDDVSNFSIAL
nr:hypothetical protein [Tanacetum cinerariifolium]